MPSPSAALDNTNKWSDLRNLKKYFHLIEYRIDRASLKVNRRSRAGILCINGVSMVAACKQKKCHLLQTAKRDHSLPHSRLKAIVTIFKEILNNDLV